MNANTKLKAKFRQYALGMLDTEHLSEMVRNNVGADIQKGDFVISTHLYDSSVFVVDPIFKRNSREESPNPYEEKVVRSKTLNLSVRAKQDPNATTEMRIKVRKLCLLRWNAESKTYPHMSQEIIFRQQLVDLKKKYTQEHAYTTDILRNRPSYIPADAYPQIEKNLLVLNHLRSIPPFLAFYDEKYGFLVKRRLAMAPIVLEEDTSTQVSTMVEKAVKETTDDMDKHAENRVPKENTSFYEAILQKALHPDRVESIVKKHGIDGVDATFGD